MGEGRGIYGGMYAYKDMRLATKLGRKHSMEPELNPLDFEGIIVSSNTIEQLFKPLISQIGNEAMCGYDDSKR